jgi:eukaryotic-like serine/threonine-protein kinase
VRNLKLFAPPFAAWYKHGEKAAAPQLQIRSGMDIPGFEIEQRIGSGGMATVWKARQLSLDRIVALKVLRSEFASDHDEVRDFVNEARAAAHLKHPNIIQVHDVAEHGGLYFIVMEFVAGETLASLLDRTGPISTRQAVRIAGDVVRALTYAWDSAGMIHRDIKPDNIMLDTDGTVKLADLGLARRPAPRTAVGAEGPIEGTPNYMAPEQARGSSRLDVRTDMYSLGATLYHLMTGRLPFADADPERVMQAQIEGQLPNPHALNPAVTHGLAAFIRRLMMKDPDNRFPDWNTVQGQLRKVAAGRILLGAREPDAISTVAPLPPAPAPAAPRATTATRRVRAPLRALLWLVLIALWIVWGRYLLRLWSDSAGAPSPAARTHLASSPASDGMTAAERRRLAPVKADIAHYLLDGAVPAALSLLDEELGAPHSAAYGDALRDVRTLVEAVPTLHGRIANTIRDAIGKRVTFVVDTRKTTLIPRAISGDNVNALLPDARGGAGRPVTFTITGLAPEEKGRWLGNAQDHATAAMKYLLYRQAGDTSLARAYAQRSGPLAEAFLAQLDDTP